MTRQDRERQDTPRTDGGQAGRADLSGFFRALGGVSDAAPRRAAAGPDLPPESRETVPTAEAPAERPDPAPPVSDPETTAASLSPRGDAPSSTMQSGTPSPPEQVETTEAASAERIVRLDPRLVRRLSPSPPPKTPDIVAVPDLGRGFGALPLPHAAQRARDDCWPVRDAADGNALVTPQAPSAIRPGVRADADAPVVRAFADPAPHRSGADIRIGVAADCAECEAVAEPGCAPTGRKPRAAPGLLHYGLFCLGVGIIGGLLLVGPSVPRLSVQPEALAPPLRAGAPAQPEVRLTPGAEAAGVVVASP
jgi:hypothetical protein